VKIEKLIEFKPKYVDVDVCAEDVAVMLGGLRPEEGDDVRMVLHLVSQACEVFKAVSDGHIKRMAERQRGIVALYLADQAARYMPEIKGADDARVAMLRGALEEYVKDDECDHGPGDESDPECKCRWCEGWRVLHETRARDAGGGERR